MNKDLMQLVESFYQITGKINKQRNNLISFEGTEPLNTAAIHLIDVVGKHPEYNATQIAETLGNTKGAVSQMTAKLEAKKLIVRKQSDVNDKEITFILTESGQKVYDGHERLHAKLYQRLSEILDEFSPEDVAKIKKAFAAIDACMTEYGHL